MGQKNREYQAYLNLALKAKLSALEFRLMKLNKRQELGENSIELIREINIVINKIEVTNNRISGDFIDKHEGETINLNDLKR